LIAEAPQVAWALDFVAHVTTFKEAVQVQIEWHRTEMCVQRELGMRCKRPPTASLLVERDCFASICSSIECPHQIDELIQLVEIISRKSCDAVDTTQRCDGEKPFDDGSAGGADVEATAAGQDLTRFEETCSQAERAIQGPLFRQDLSTRLNGANLGVLGPT
jgi:hypothetical protein